MKPRRKRANVRKEYQDEYAKRKLAPALAMKVITKTYFDLKLAIIDDTKIEAKARPKLTALDKRAI